MTQSSPLDPKNTPLEGQATRDLKLALRGLNYDLNTELESFRKWRQQAQKSSNAQAPGLVTLPTEVSRAYRRMQSPQTKPKVPKLSMPNFNLSSVTSSITPVTLAAGAIILLSLGSILMLFTNRGGKGESTTAATTAPVQSVNPSKSGSVMPSSTQPLKSSTSLAVAPTPKTQPKPLTQGQPQPSEAKATQPIPKAVAVQQKSVKIGDSSAFSTFKGYGYYYVFVPIDRSKDLGRLKAMASGAYPRVIDGRTYMQMAAYDSDRRAQILAGQLRQRGYTVAVRK
jgi:hypothetical protein